jgi:hypothetical protein
VAFGSIALGLAAGIVAGRMTGLLAATDGFKRIEGVENEVCKTTQNMS